MSLSFPADDGPKFTPCPEGTHIARCFRFIDLGTQRNEYKGDVKHQRMVMFTWEIPAERLTGEDKDGNPYDKPFTISKRYTWSMFEKATLRKHMESWRGKSFTDAELQAGEARPIDFLGQPCLVNVVHKVPQAGGDPYAKLENVLPLMADMQCGSQENQTVYLDLTPEGFKPEVFEALHEKTREQIQSSPEYKGLSDPSLNDDGSAGQAGQVSPQDTVAGSSQRPLDYDERNPPPATSPNDYADASGR